MYLWALKSKYTAQYPPSMFAGGGGTLRFLIVSVILRFPSVSVEYVAFSMSRASMLLPSPAGKLFGASFVKSTICGPGQGLPGGGGGGGTGALQSLVSANPVVALSPVQCRVR